MTVSSTHDRRGPQDGDYLLWERARRALFLARSAILTLDPKAPVRTVDDLIARMPNASLEAWPDVAHHSMLERPVRFNERLRAFVRDEASSDALSTG